MKGLAAFALVAVLLGTGGYMAKLSEPQIKSGHNDAHLFGEMQGSAAASVFGQFRSNFAGYLWLKIDEYMHGGVVYRPLTDYEKEHLASQSDEHHDHEGHDHAFDEACNETVKTSVVPHKSDDFRGIFGDIERQTQPYFSRHTHSHHDPIEALPLFRLATLSDPHFILGYVVGASVISRDAKHIPTAIEFLKEGVKHNPLNISLKGELGRMYCYHLKDYSTALNYLNDAVALAEKTDNLSEEDSEALLYVFRWQAWCYREMKDIPKARASLARALHVFPDDKVLHIMKDNLEKSIAPKR